jgi:hypothetical protein
MKRAVNKFRSMLIHKLIFTLFAVSFFFLPKAALAQEDSTKQEENDKVSPAIELLSIQKGDNTIDLKANLRAKIKGTLTKLSGLKVEFFQTGDTEDKKLGEAISGSNGVAVVNIKSEGVTTDKEGKLNFKVVFPGNSTFESAEEVLAIKKAKLILTPVKEDSSLSVQVKLVDISTGTETTIPETNLSVYVKRMFSALKVGEGTTDENGEATIEIPNSLPGDEKGNLTLIARLEDNEVYGNLETANIQKWGTPVSNVSKELPRALWSPDPPIWMLITFIVLMTLVWGHYLVIIYELFRLRKEHT